MTAFYYLPHELEFINYIKTLDNIVILKKKEYKIDNDKFLTNANYSRWKKQTINNLNCKGSLYKKLYYLYLKNNVEEIEFNWIINNIKIFNDFINIERYIDIKLHPSINHFKSFNYKDLTPTYLKWLEGYNPLEFADDKLCRHIKTLTLKIIKSFVDSHYSISCLTPDKLKNYLIYNLKNTYLDDNYIKTKFKLDKNENIYQQIEDILKKYNANIIYDISELSDNYLEIEYDGACVTDFTTFLKESISTIIETENKKLYFNQPNRFRKYYLKGYDENNKLDKWSFKLETIDKYKCRDFHYTESLGKNYVDINMLKYYSIYIIIKNNLNHKDIDKLYLNNYLENKENKKKQMLKILLRKRKTALKYKKSMALDKKYKKEKIFS